MNGSDAVRFACPSAAWFERIPVAYTALWWIPRGHIPTTAEAEDRVRLLRLHGPSPAAFTLRVHFPPPGSVEQPPRPGHDDWLCPA